ncbi:hypothetical protein RB213_008207 [Colletotrichum asianum]
MRGLFVNSTNTTVTAHPRHRSTLGGRWAWHHFPFTFAAMQNANQRPPPLSWTSGGERSPIRLSTLGLATFH